MQMKVIHETVISWLQIDSGKMFQTKCYSLGISQETPMEGKLSSSTGTTLGRNLIHHCSWSGILAGSLLEVKYLSIAFACRCSSGES